MADSGYVTTAEGHRLFIRDWGTGAPVLVLAGWAMNSDLWGEVMVALSDRACARSHTTDAGTADRAIQVA